ncbi:MAG: ABC transporter permease [Chloroflexi bacterium]|nr:ABC transporter permease [Chloroflexota bacterium]MCA2000809.1 ABC transporter permease [Chloroflexota bacterium]
MSQLANPPAALDAPSASMASGVWKRFRKHPGAIFGFVVISTLIILALLAPLSPYNPEASEMEIRNQPPAWNHIMGTDALGRDLFTRVLYGGRVSLTVGLLVVLFSITIGVPIGALAGYYGGAVDSVLMRLTDAFLSLPSFLVLILLSAILREVEAPLFERNNVLTISLVIGAFGWTTFARLVRAAFLTLRETDFVAAVRALGGSDLRIILRHILPNAIGPITVEATLEFGYAIIEESGLSFLGFGIQPPTPSWGNLLSNAQEHFTKYPWLAIFPGLMIFFSIISINYIGDGLRDAFDPYKVLEKVGEV